MMIKSLIGLLAFTIITIASKGQKEANVWHFGHGEGLDFNSGEAVQITGAMSTFEGCTAYSDSMGNLLFYSNGGGRIPIGGQSTGQIWNRNDEVMYDMQGVEGGGFSAVQSSVIIPCPGEPDIYYLFTVDEIEHFVDATPEVLAAEPNGRGLRYFKVDMSLNDGLGEVIEADVEVYDYSLEGLCAVRHANQSDYWILINQDTTGIGVYSVTEAGVALSSVYETPFARGAIKASPLTAEPDFTWGHKVVTSLGLMLDINLTTGELSNPELLPVGVSEVFEFAQNGYYLYGTLTDGGTFNQQLMRYNTLTAFTDEVTVASTQELIAPDITAFYMQVAPDHKIYYTALNLQGEILLGSIDCPNSEEPGLTPEAFNYGGGDEEIFISLPNFPAWVFYSSFEDQIEFGPDTVFLCAGDTLVLDAGPGEYWEWGGDCFSGPEDTWPDNATRYFTVTQPGTYVACVNGPCSSGLGADGCSSSDQITVLPCGSEEPPCDLLDLAESVTICAGDSVQLDADLSQLGDYTGLQWSGGSGTFIPSDTIPDPLYVPSLQEVQQGFVNLTLSVFSSEAGLGEGRLMAYDHSGEDLIFYIDQEDGSVDAIQSNTGFDWTAMGFRQADCRLYGLANIVEQPALYSVNLLGEDAEFIAGYPIDFFAGDYDNENDLFYAIGMNALNNGLPQEQYLMTVDPVDGTLDTIGGLNLPGLDGFFVATGDGINGLAYDPSLDVLFAVTQVGQLLEINPTNAEVTVVGNTQPDLRGLAYHEDLNQLWGITASALLLQINKLTGAVIEEVLCQEEFNVVTSLTFARPACEEGGVCSDQISVVIRNDTSIDLGDDETLCEGETLVLTAPGFESYLWQDGSTDETLEVTESGVYTLQAVDDFGCALEGEVAVNFTPAPNPGFTADPQPTTILDTEISFTALASGNGLTYNWTFDQGIPDTATTAVPVVTFPPVPGSYPVTLNVVDASGCSSSIASFIIITADGQITMPNIFSPNGDGDNDRFVPFEEFPGKWELIIFNRWGAELFRTTAITRGWGGDGASEGTYYWVLQPLAGQPGESRSGYVQLVR
jgi:gliding motility-associated-like protein